MSACHQASALRQPWDARGTQGRARAASMCMCMLCTRTCTHTCWSLHALRSFCLLHKRLLWSTAYGNMRSVTRIHLASAAPQLEGGICGSSDITDDII